LNAFIERLDGLPPAARVIARMICLTGVWSSMGTVSALPGEVDLENPPAALTSSKLIDGLSRSAILEARVDEMFWVQSLAHLLIDIASGYYPEHAPEIKEAFHAFTEREYLADVAHYRG
jgi:hypothetical protein